MNRYFYFLLGASLIYFVSCDKLPTQQGANSHLSKASINLGLKVEPVSGMQVQSTDTNKLCLRLYSQGEENIYDTLKFTSNQDYLAKTYSLQVPKMWNAKGEIYDRNDSNTHSVSNSFLADDMDDDIVLQFIPNFFSLNAAFYPLSNYSIPQGEITRFEIVIDNKIVADTTDNKSYFAGVDTVTLGCNYVRLGKTHEITLNVYGTYFNDSRVLYTGTIQKLFTYDSDDSPITIPLHWAGSDTAPFPIRMEVVIIPTPKVKINGQIGDHPRTY